MMLPVWFSSRAMWPLSHMWVVVVEFELFVPVVPVVLIGVISLEWRRPSAL